MHYGARWIILPGWKYNHIDVPRRGIHYQHRYNILLHMVSYGYAIFIWGYKLYNVPRGVLLPQ